MLKQIASMTLDVLVNQQAIKLAINTNKLPENIKYYYPLKFSLNSLNRDNEYSFKIAVNDEISCNKFQKEFIDSIETQSATNDNKNIISISAPTSAGKPGYLFKKASQAIIRLLNSSLVITRLPSSNNSLFSLLRIT